MTTNTGTITTTPTDPRSDVRMRRAGPATGPLSSQASFFLPPDTRSTPSNAPYPTLTSGLQAMPQVLPRLMDQRE